MARKTEQQVSYLGKVIVYGNPNYHYDKDQEDFVPTNENDKTPVCEILDVEEVTNDRVITGKYVFPIADASICTSDEGLIYSYNCSLPYLKETAHLAEVEKNTIMQQAFLYAGRVTQQNKPGLMMWMLVGLLGLMAIIGMFK